MRADDEPKLRRARPRQGAHAPMPSGPRAGRSGVGHGGAVGEDSLYLAGFARYGVRPDRYGVVAQLV